MRKDTPASTDPVDTNPYYKKLARWVRDHFKSDDPLLRTGAHERIARALPAFALPPDALPGDRARLQETFRVGDAQTVVAREQGFANWNDFVDGDVRRERIDIARELGEALLHLHTTLSGLEQWEGEIREGWLLDPYGNEVETLAGILEGATSALSRAGYDVGEESFEEAEGFGRGYFIYRNAGRTWSVEWYATGKPSEAGTYCAGPFGEHDAADQWIADHPVPDGLSPHEAYDLPSAPPEPEGAPVETAKSDGMAVTTEDGFSQDVSDRILALAGEVYSSALVTMEAQVIRAEARRSYATWKAELTQRWMADPLFDKRFAGRLRDIAADVVRERGEVQGSQEFANISSATVRAFWDEWHRLSDSYAFWRDHVTPGLGTILECRDGFSHTEIGELHEIARRASDDDRLVLRADSETVDEGYPAWAAEQIRILSTGDLYRHGYRPEIFAVVKRAAERLDVGRRTRKRLMDRAEQEVWSFWHLRNDSRAFWTENVQTRREG